MDDWNARIFITAQFGSRFLNSFLTTAVRYELLETGGIAKFASAQVANQAARVCMQQLSGVLTDSFPLKRLYVLGEAFNFVLIVAMLLSMFGVSTMLFAVNVALGLAQAFTQPVAKSLPPAVVSAENLAVVNSWDLTGDKIARNLAPMVLTIVLSSFGYHTAVFLSLILCSALVALKQILIVADQPVKNSSHAGAGSSVPRLLAKIFVQIWEGILSLRDDRTIGLLILNTIITNMLIYPLGSVVFPVIFKAIPEGAVEQDTSLVSRMILSIQGLLGIQKKKAWMNYVALVSLGGVIGPFLSSAIVYRIKAFTARHPEQVNWIGLNFGISGQIVTFSLLIIVLKFLSYFEAGARIFLLFVVWGAMQALNNVTTIYFNAHTQQRLSRTERGKFIANILTLFTLANSVGSLLYGWILSPAGSLDEQISTSTNLLVMALLMRILIFASVRTDMVGKQTVMLKNTDPSKSTN